MTPEALEMNKRYAARVLELEAEIEKQRKGLRHMESVLGWNPTEEPIEMCDMALAVRDLEAENEMKENAYQTACIELRKLEAENADLRDGAHRDGLLRVRYAAENEAMRKDAARYRYVRAKPEMLLHLSNKDFDSAIDAAMGEQL